MLQVKEKESPTAALSVDALDRRVFNKNAELQHNLLKDDINICCIILR